LSSALRSSGATKNTSRAKLVASRPPGPTGSRIPRPATLTSNVGTFAQWHGAARAPGMHWARANGLGPGQITVVSHAAHIGWMTNGDRFPNYVGRTEFSGFLSRFVSRVFHPRGCCEVAPPWRSLDLANKSAAGDGSVIGVGDFRSPVWKGRRAARKKRY